MIKIKKLVKDKKGAIESLYHVIGVIMLLMALGAFLDFMIVQQKIQTSNQVATEVARIAGIQGGILNRAPQGYPGGDRAYVNNRNITDIINEVLREVGIGEGDYELTINNTRVNNSSGSNRIEYKRPVNVKLTIKYDYMFLGRILNWRENRFSSKRVSVSEWKYDYNNWDGEY